nr:galaxin isoform X1 [Misgurnus anguillicaudatus]XP_055029562.1 galaxin isoform X1 [Misgurnus anguillicaudatus]
MLKVFTIHSTYLEGSDECNQWLNTGTQKPTLSHVLVTILCLFATFSAQATHHHGDRDRNVSSSPNGSMPHHHHHECKNVSYNISNSSCCKGNITSGISMLVADCCGSVAYNPLNQICCGDQILTRDNAQAKCCGSEMYLPTTHMCCTPNTIKSRDKKCTIVSNGTATDNGTKGVAQTQETMFCLGKEYQVSALHKCCGEKHYSLSDDTVLCCNGTLYLNVPKNSECVGGLIYAQDRIKMTCGSKVYDHESSRCCSGHLYNITQVAGKAECCGNLLLKDENQTCCSSTSHALVYETKDNHLCCGHYYYNKSLWSCCAGHLKPTPKTDNSTGEYPLKPLTDLIPDMCNKTAVFGKVESVALDQNQRYVIFRVVEDVSLSHCERLVHVTLDHCDTPALEEGMTYLWDSQKFKPISLPVDPTYDNHMFLAACKMIKTKKRNFCEVCLGHFHANSCII